MAKLDMNGPFSFTSEKIDQNVTKTSPGNYALGYITQKKEFIVTYVGRSDVDLNQELKNRLEPKYKEFMYSYATSPQAAFKKECRTYHDSGGKINLDNEKHPDRPDGTYWKCPVCGA